MDPHYLQPHPIPFQPEHPLPDSGMEFVEFSPYDQELMMRISALQQNIFALRERLHREHALLEQERAWSGTNLTPSMPLSYPVRPTERECSRPVSRESQEPVFNRNQLLEIKTSCDTELNRLGNYIENLKAIKAQWFQRGAAEEHPAGFDCAYTN